MYCGVIEITEGIMQLVGCEMADLSSGFCWNMAVASIPEVQRALNMHQQSISACALMKHALENKVY